MKMKEKEIVHHLKDGRRLAYLEYGEPDGIPVMLFHGTPGSKAWFLEDDDTAISLGLRLIATDRPGFGGSDPKPNRTLLDWADDIAELATHLNLQRFAIIGVSGGGAYAAACAYKIPSKLTHVSIVAGATPFLNGQPPKSMMKANRRAFFMAKRVPWILRMSYKAQKKMMEKQPEKFIKLIKDGNSHLAKWDQQFTQEDGYGEEFLLHMGEAFKHRIDEGVHEPRLLSMPWRFSPSDIHFPLHIWHGEEDRMSPYSEMVKLAATIPNCQTHFIPQAGHFLIADLQIWEAILKTIKADSRSGMTDVDGGKRSREVLEPL
ncbi:alpha/beta fold hydrolase [Bacillus horti]|uniref:Pimeloyl-ACP methyl ester carboxylesterase n=1 Tax=Caldalkalibacillus horti TaxID=77523 RepID=A0ABT9W5E3_9BACI|nr:alpha/beta hydrolase [Bacillus horti]MDQ0168478.1 pimeloyl-ACP methyl ester carboxylesterase [Bacillus horti]